MNKISFRTMLSATVVSVALMGSQFAWAGNNTTTTSNTGFSRPAASAPTPAPAASAPRASAPAAVSAPAVKAPEAKSTPDTKPAASPAPAATNSGFTKPPVAANTNTPATPVTVAPVVDNTAVKTVPMPATMAPKPPVTAPTGALAGAGIAAGAAITYQQMQADKNSTINTTPANNNTAPAGAVGRGPANVATNTTSTTAPPSRATVERETTARSSGYDNNYYQPTRSAPEVVVVPSSPQVVYVPTPMPSATTVMPSAPVYNSTVPSMPMAPMTPAPVAYTGERGGHSPWPWILGGLMVVAVVGGVVYMARQ